MLLTKNNPNVIGSFTGAALGIIYSFYNYLMFQYTSYTSLPVYMVSNILYFSLLGFLIGVIINLSLKSKKVQIWHIGALFGFVVYLVIIIFSSISSQGLLCRTFLTLTFECNFLDFINRMILDGPVPLHLLQILLILLGMLIGLILSNNEMMKNEIRRKRA